MQRSPSPDTSEILKTVFGEDESEEVALGTLTLADKAGSSVPVARAVPVTGRSKNLARILIPALFPRFHDISPPAFQRYRRSAGLICELIMILWLDDVLIHNFLLCWSSFK